MAILMIAWFPMRLSNGFRNYCTIAYSLKKGQSAVTIAYPVIRY